MPTMHSRLGRILASPPHPALPRATPCTMTAHPSSPKQPSRDLPRPDDMCHTKHVYRSGGQRKTVP
ncbi:hypothetical protein BO71DRAFT_398849 [Aspergillus ellipticus CBS 707.79]|uniref:Uncharacterized protein n=1 Tax=Aspergillus ellipticus CBS 707.79 TaxID=1448320 RepID=A0A319DB98_9EURO|nr:hypothetical protein BO71DRAFT_398849 [Aspergillus ellipticus CBS 707.79]